MRSLIVEDNPTERRLLEILLAPYGDCALVANGPAGLQAFSAAEFLPYDLICLDIQMPGMDGQNVLKAIRAIEAGRGVLAGHGVKIIMTTMLGDGSNVMQAFREFCDGYLVKPVDCRKLEKLLVELALVQPAVAAESHV